MFWTKWGIKKYSIHPADETQTFYKNKICSTQTGTQKKQNAVFTGFSADLAAMWLKGNFFMRRKFKK